MTINEARRLALHRNLEQVLGSDEAATMMEYLPPVGWQDLARQTDLLAVRSDLNAVKTDLNAVKTDLHAVKTDLHVATIELRGEIAAVSTELRGEIAGASTELRGQMHRLELLYHDLRAEMHEGFGAVRTDFAAIIAAQTRSMVLMIVGALATITAIAFTAAHVS